MGDSVIPAAYISTTGEPVSGLTGNWFPDPISIAWLVAALVVLYIVVGG